MAIIYSYPIATPKSKDLLVGTSVFDENDPSSERTNPTVSFTVQSLINLIGPIIGTPNLQQVTGAGNTTTNSITIANSLSVNGSYIDSYGQSGSNGQVLTSDGTDIAFADAAGGPAYTRAASAPGSPSAGDWWFNTTYNVLYIYDGTRCQRDS